MRKIIIAAMTKDRVIGKDNTIPWHLSEDLKLFKKFTTDNTIIMGRKTYDSIGKPLPNRKNVVLSRSVTEIEGITMASNWDEALSKAEAFGKDIYFVGGAFIYEKALEVADSMYLSFVKGEYEGNIFFPEFAPRDWKVVEEEDFGDFVLKKMDRV